MISSPFCCCAPAPQVWNETLTAALQLPKTGPGTGTRARISVWDHNKGADELVGVASVDIGTLAARQTTVDHSKTQYSRPTWINLYGPPTTRSGENSSLISKCTDVADNMNSGKVPGSAFRGRVLVTLSLTPSTNVTLHGIQDPSPGPVHPAL